MPAWPTRRGHAGVFPAWTRSGPERRSSTFLLRREVGADLSIHPHGDGLRMASIHDGDVNAGLAGQLRGAELRSHAATAQRALAAALRFERGSEFANHALQARLFAAVGHHESIDVGEQ